MIGHLRKWRPREGKSCPQDPRASQWQSWVPNGSRIPDVLVILLVSITFLALG